MKEKTDPMKKRMTIVVALLAAAVIASMILLAGRLAHLVREMHGR